MLKIQFLLLLVVVLVLSCGETPKDNELVIWNQMRHEGRAVLHDLLDEFMAENPGIKVRSTYYENEEMRTNFIFSALGKSGPDMVFGPADNVGPYAEIDIAHYLEDIFEPAFFDQFEDQARVRRTVRGETHTYAIADRVGNHLALVYNKKFIKTPPTTFTELFEVGQQLTRDFDNDGYMDQYGLAWNFIEPYFMIPFLGSYGGWVMDADENPTLDSPAMVKAAQLINDLRLKYKIVPSYSDYDIAASLFKQNKAAMLIDGPWAWGEYGKSGIDYGIARIPLNDETGIWPTPMVSPLGWTLNKNVTGQRLENVKKLLRFLMRKESQLAFSQKLNTIPTSKAALQDSLFLNNELAQASLHVRNAGKLMPTTPALRGIWNAMKPAYQAIINGSLAPDKAAAKMQKDAEKFLAEMFEQ
jgi:arabinogalactan oligomer/maltooligosaccharide transport system permease protein